MEELEAIAKAWNSLETDEERWEYLVSHKNELGLRLDNDATLVCFHDDLISDDIEDLDDLPNLEDFDSWIGNAPGIDDLMEALGIQAEGV